MSKRVDFLDGLKGLMVIFVVLTHYFLALYPQGYIGYGSNVVGDPKEAVIANLPWSLFSNTSINLYMFLALIPVFIVLSYRRHGNDIAVLQRQAATRYFQFVIPVFAATVLAFIGYESGFFQYEAMAEMTDSSWSLSIIPTTDNPFWMLFSGLFSIYFNQSVECLTVLWCMHIIFIGSMLTYGIWALFGQSKYRYLPGIVYLIIGCFFTEYLVFAGGSIIGEILYIQQTEKGKEKQNKKQWLGWLCTIAGIVFSFLPSAFLPKYVTLHMTYGLATFLLLYGTLNINLLQRILNNKGLISISQYGFSIVLSHIFVLFTFSYWFYKVLMGVISDPGILLFVTFVVSFVVVLICSKIFFELFEKPSRLLAKKVYKRKDVLY